MNSNILVTGCCGFLGSNMSDFLLKQGHKVIGIDNLLTGKKYNIQKLLGNEDFKFLEIDVCKPLSFEFKFDKIIHFASTASPKDYLEYPIKTLRIGSLGTENVLRLGLKNKSTVLVASTSEIYGDPLEHPQNESYFGNVNPIGPRGVYDEAKRYLEAITMAYKRKKNLDTRIIRIFNTYGPKMRKDDGRAIPNFINQMLNNKNVTIYGDGSQTRSFCYIDDTIDGIYKALNSNYNLPINIGNPDEYSILELVTMLRKLINCSSEIQYLDLPENDPMVRKPDITLAKKILDWKPKVQISDGLKKTIKYFNDL